MSKRTGIVATIVVAIALFAVIGAAALGIAVKEANSMTPEQHYVQEVRAEIIDGDDASDRDLLAFGATICRTIASGVSEQRMVEVGPTQGLTLRETKAFIEAAKKYLCRE